MPQEVVAMISLHEAVIKNQWRRRMASEGKAKTSWTVISLYGGGITSCVQTLLHTTPYYY